MLLTRKSLPLLLAATLAISTLAPAAHALTPSAMEQYQKAVTLEKQKDYRGAEQAYRTALALDPYDSMTYQRLGDLLQKGGRKDEALQLFQKALELSPNDPMIHMSIGQIWESKGQHAKALTEYRTVLEKNPEYTYAYWPMARAEKALKRPDEAVEHYRSFLKAYPQHEDAKRELAMLLMSQKQFGPAADAYASLKDQSRERFKDDLAYGVALNKADRSEEALQAFQAVKTPSAALYEQQGIALEKLNRIPEAYAAYQKAIEMAPKDKANLSLKLADLAETMNRPEQAAENLSTYLQRDPKNTKVQKHLADLYLQQKNYAKAIPAYEKLMAQAISLTATDRAVVIRNLGYAYQMNGQTEDALTMYDNALKVEDNNQIRLNMAIIHHQKGNYAKAAELYRKLLVADPQSESVRRDLGQVLMLMGREAYDKGNYQEALDHYQDAYLLGNEQGSAALLGIANTQYAMKNESLAYASYQRLLDKDPDNIPARLNKAQIDLAQNNTMAAVENLRWVTEKQPDNLEANRMLAQTYDRLGDHGKAIEYYQQALRSKPQDSALLLSYGNAWRQTGDLARAQRAYELAKQHDPDNPLVYFNLGSLHNLNNKPDESATAYKAALRLDPNYMDAYYGLGTTLEKQKKYQESLQAYQSYVQKAKPDAPYLTTAKSRIDIINGVLKPAAKSSVKPAPAESAKKPAPETRKQEAASTSKPKPNAPAKAFTPTKPNASASSNNGKTSKINAPR